MVITSEIINELKSAVGEKWVLNKPADMAMYSFDSALDKATPSLVVIPKTTDQVARTIGILYKNKIPYVARGAATSLCGGPIPLNGAVVVGLSRLKKIGSYNKAINEIFVEPGVVNLRLQQELIPLGLFFPPDPGSQKACTIGGNVATNAGGPHCLKYGVTSHYVSGINVVLPNGKGARFHIKDPGYDLVGLFVGSEGTLGVVTGIQLSLKKIPSQVKTMLVSFRSMEDAIQSVTDIIAAGILPATLEAMDKTVIQAVEAFSKAGYPMEAEAVLLIELDGEKLEDLDRQAGTIQEICQKNNSFDFRLAKDEKERIKLWEGRRGSYPAMARLAPNVLVEDGAVPRTKLPDVLKKIKEIAENFDLRVALLFHAGDGNIHPQIIFDERDKAQTKKVKEAGYQMLKACVDLGGTISGEHGIGIDKREAMKWLFSRETLSLFRRIKNAFDPENFCNPDKLIPLVSKGVVVTRDPSKPNFELSPMGAEDPENENSLVKIIQEAANLQRGFGVQGSKSKFKVKENLMISLAKLNKILDFDKGNLTLTVQAGALIENIRPEVEAAGQYLWVGGHGTIGGIVATKSQSYPSLRDIVIGMRVLLPTGELVQFGAKTMKNVAGYDCAKLLIGSWGSLGIILDVTFRLFPFPPDRLASTPVKPFVMTEIHKKIKRAFDPANIMAPRMMMMTADDIQSVTTQSPAMSAAEDALGKMEDRFWSE